MDAFKSELNRKRQQEDENRSSPQQKSQRLFAKSQPSVSSDEPMKITDLVDDCLVKIFEHLDVCNLFNVAVANEWLRPAVGAVYKRKFGVMEIRIVANHYASASGLEPYISSKVICIIGLKMCLQFLRCLGPSISNLNIRYYGWHRKQCNHIHHYMNTFCTDSLVNIEFWDKPNGNRIKQFEKPFVNVRLVKVCCSCLGDQLPFYQQWFPNMRSLELDNVRTIQHIRTSFPCLEDLRVSINDNGDLGCTKMKAISLLRQYPQLHSLEIRTSKRQTMDTLLNIIKYNQTICNLKIKMYWFVAVINFSDIERLTQEHPLLIELELAGFKFSTDDVITLVGQFNWLKQFRFQIINRVEYDRLVSKLDSRWRPSLQVLGAHDVTLQRLC